MNNEIIIRNLDPQEITINEGGTITGITNVYVNGTDVTIGTKAYVIVPTKLSELTNDEGFITNAEETDPTVPSYVKEITMADINSWNDKQDQLVSTQNIKSINGNSILGSGNLNITTEYTAGVGIDITDNTISNTITSYNDLTDTPTPIQYTSQLINDSGYITNSVDDLQNYLTTSVLESILPHSSDSGTGPLYLEDSAHYKLDITLNPSEIEQTTYNGTNLFNEMETPFIENTHYDSSGTIQVWTNYVGIREYMNVAPDTTYVQSNSLELNIARVCFYDSDKTFLSAATTNTFTTPNNCYYIRFSIYSSGTIIPTWCQVEQGSTATSYEPYVGGMPSPNPLYPQNIHVVTGENSITVSSKNLLSVPFTQYNVNNLRTEIPNFKAGTYTFSFTGSLSATWQVTARKIVDGTTTQLTYVYNNYKLTFTLDEDATLQLEIYRTGILLSDVSNLMVEPGSTATTYVSHQETIYPIDLGTNEYLKIGDTTDRIFKNIPSDPDWVSSESLQGKWLKKSNIEKIWYTDIGNFSYGGHSDDGYYYFSNYSPVNVPATSTLETHSEYFKPYNADLSSLNWINTDYNFVGISIDDRVGITTAEDLNTWISDVNLTGYVKTSGYYITLLNDTLNQQLEAIHNAVAYEGGTIISQTNDDLAFDIIADTLRKIS